VRATWFATGLVVGMMAIAGCSSSPEVTAAKANAAVPSVAVGRARRANLERRITLTAELVPFEEIDVMAKVSGYVRQISVDAGSRVSQGQLLAELEVPEMRADLVRSEAEIQRRSAELERARDDLRRAQSGYNFAHLSYERLASVLKTRPGLVAQQEIDDARGKDLMAEAQLASARSNLSAAEQQVRVVEADRDRLKTMYSYTKVTAPFAGTVTKRFASTGSMIQAGTASNAMPLVRLSSNSRLRLVLPVPESAVSTIQAGQPVEVRVKALGRSFPGVIARSANKVQTATRTMDTEVDVANPQLTLVPGMYAEVDLVLERRLDVVAVPIAAKSTEGDHDAVYLVNANGQVELRRVELGIETPDLVEVRKGLAPREFVVVGNRSGLKDGQKVDPHVVELGVAPGVK
jgi:RND family efflux transporter MFP subunit